MAKQKISDARLKKLVASNLDKSLTGAGRIERPRAIRNADSRLAVARALAPTFDPATLEKLTAITERDQLKLAARLKKSKAEAVRASRGHQKALNSQFAKHLANLKASTQLAIGSSALDHIFLRRPFVIGAARDATLERSRIVEGNSFAKFRAHAQDNNDFAGDVGFGYVWVNPKTTFEVISITGLLTFNGHCSLGTGSGTFPGDRRASVAVAGRLDILNVSDDPATSPPGQPDQFASVLFMAEDTSGWCEVGAVNARDVSRGFALNHNLMVVPPLATLVFTVIATVTLDTGSDSSIAEADFASGGFQVGSPAVVLATFTA